MADEITQAATANPSLALSNPQTLNSPVDPAIVAAVTYAQEAARAKQADKAETTSPPPSTITPPPTQQQPQTVTIPLDEFHRYRGFETQLNEITRAKAAEIEAKEQERIKALAEKGQVEQALEALNKANADKLAAESQRYADLERQVFQERKAAVVAQAMAGRVFRSDAAARQVESLISVGIEVVRDASGKLQVIDATTRQPAADAIRMKLDTEEFHHFFAPTTTTGGANQQGSRAATQAVNEPAPGSIEHIAAEFKKARANTGAIGLRRVS